jgi:hypothetical protein
MVLIFSIFVGGVILALTHAIYQPDCVILAAGLFLICFLVGRVKPRALLLSTNDPVEKNSPFAVAVLFAVLLSQDQELLYANVVWGVNSLRGTSICCRTPLVNCGACSNDLSKRIFCKMGHCIYRMRCSLSGCGEIFGSDGKPVAFY